VGEYSFDKKEASGPRRSAKREGDRRVTGELDREKTDSRETSFETPRERKKRDSTLKRRPSLGGEFEPKQGTTRVQILGIGGTIQGRIGVARAAYALRNA